MSSLFDTRRPSRYDARDSDTMRGILCGIAILSLLVWGGMRLYASYISYPQQVGGHLKRAADANTVSIAKQELEIAVGNMEAMGLTQGNTGIIWSTPAHDIGFWYNNVKAALQELNDLPEQVTPMERTNVLMKLRETLTDDGQHGTVVTQPEGIEIYPSNRAYLLWALISGAVALVFGWRWLYD